MPSRGPRLNFLNITVGIVNAVTKILRVFLISTFIFFLTPSVSAEQESEWNALNLKARDLLVAGKVTEAIEVSKQSLEFARKNLEPNHPNIAKALNNLGVIYF